MDPACGSGHILVEAYDLFKEIYLERGYRTRDIPRLILEKNLYGLDIDDRAAQMAGFALLMKARADDRRILSGDDSPKINVMAIQESKGIDADEVANNFLKGKSDITKQDIKDLLEFFEYGKTFGSLITVPDELSKKLKIIELQIASQIESSDLFTRKTASTLLPYVKQGLLLADKYDCSITNPPYMGNNAMNADLKEFAKIVYPDSKADIFAMFIERCFGIVNKTGFNSMITMHSWMFLPAFEKRRRHYLAKKTLITMAHLGARAFSEISGEVVQTTSFVMCNKHFHDYQPMFIDLVAEQEYEKKTKILNKENRVSNLKQNDFEKIPGSPLAYWVSHNIRDLFIGKSIGDLTISDGQTKSGNNDKFLRAIWEVKFSQIGNGEKWVLHPKGGGNRKWFGNVDTVIDWSDEARAHYRKDRVARILPEYLWNKIGFCWSLISTSDIFGFRLKREDEIFNLAAPTLFPKKDDDVNYLLAFVNTKISNYIMHIFNPTLNCNVGDVQNLPLKELNSEQLEKISELVNTAIEITKFDWDSFETSCEFRSFPWLASPLKAEHTEQSFNNWQNHCTSQVRKMQELETENNRLFIEAYGLRDELNPEVPKDQITLARADREEDVKRLISYSIGCMMGRYSLDQSGLIYAHSSNEGFDQSKYQSFPADDDGIVPIMDMEWFDDDAAVRFDNFVKVAWSSETLEENLKFIADSLSPKRGEASRDTIRRYFSSSFFKDHLKTYKKRPIYWLFSSGKLKAFECLVYLHRYNESTLSRMRNEYVTPLQGKFTARADYLQSQIDSAASASERNQLQKQLDTLRKKQAELKTFDDELRHYADQRIKLDLDDGVKVNYGKFGNLLAEVKAITGKKKK